MHAQAAEHTPAFEFKYPRPSRLARIVKFHSAKSLFELSFINFAQRAGCGRARRNCVWWGNDRGQIAWENCSLMHGHYGYLLNLTLSFSTRECGCMEKERETAIYLLVWAENNDMNIVIWTEFCGGARDRERPKRNRFDALRKSRSLSHTHSNAKRQKALCNRLIYT